MEQEQMAAVAEGSAPAGGADTSENGQGAGAGTPVGTSAGAPVGTACGEAGGAQETSTPGMGGESAPAGDGVDPDGADSDGAEFARKVLLPLFEQWKGADPDYAALRKKQAEASARLAAEQQISALQSAYPELAVDRSQGDLNLPNAAAIARHIRQGASLVDAYRLANFDSIREQAASSAQRSAVEGILSNARSTPGALASGGGNPSAGVWSMSGDDFRRMQEKALAGELSGGRHSSGTKKR